MSKVQLICNQCANPCMIMGDVQGEVKPTCIFNNDWVADFIPLMLVIERMKMYLKYKDIIKKLEGDKHGN